MTDISWWGYLGMFAGAGVLSVALTPVARAIAMRFEVVDHPGGYKQQQNPVPYLGGVAIAVAFSAIIVAASVLSPGLPGWEPTIILGLAVGLAVVGLLDDLGGLSPWLRLSFQALAALAAIGAGIQVSIFDSAVLNGLVTVVWIVAVTNAFNLLDNMDGLSAGVAAIASGFFFVIAALNGQFLVASLSVALSGCALGFLWHNFHPASIYMGDAGSLFFGFLLSILGVKLRFDGPTEVTFFVPVLVVGVALFDTALVTIGRIAHGLNPLSGGRDHTSHRLVRVGLGVRAAVGVIYVAAVGGGVLALIMSRVDRVDGLLLMGLVSVLALVAGSALLTVPVYERDAGVVPIRSPSREEAS